MSKFLQGLYTVFLAILIALFVGVGIQAFYPFPDFPDYPSELEQSQLGVSTLPDEEVSRIQEDYDVIVKDFEQESEKHSRNVSMFSIGISVLLLILSLTVLQKLSLISDAVLFGGIFVLVYAVIMGIASGDDMIRFLIVTASLIVAIVVGYFRIIRPKNKAKVA